MKQEKKLNKTWKITGASEFLENNLEELKKK
jgi:hypothetical protein